MMSPKYASVDLENGATPTASHDIIHNFLLRELYLRLTQHS